MIELNTKEANEQIFSVFKDIEVSSAAVKVCRDKKVVAEIVPVASRVALSETEFVYEESEGYVYQTMGETLSKL